MLLTLTPNPCLEKTFRVPDFVANGSFRIAPEATHENVGGKGINAARVAARFGVRSVALAPLGPNLRDHLKQLAAPEAFELHGIEVEALTRTCHNVVAHDGVTELLEAGYPLSVGDGTRLFEAWRGQLGACELALLGGSYPSSNNSAWLQHASILCSMARAANKKLIYDGKGEAFRRAVFGANLPWAIKPNLEEARELLRAPLETRDDERGAVRQLRRRGIDLVMLSCGARGLWVGWENEIEWFMAPKIETVSAVGSGDSLCGAFAAKYLETGDVWESVRWGVAAGTANAARLEAACVGPYEVAPLVPQVHRELGEIRLMN
ncbi:tagatose-6-phosphate kinase [Abditibacteriota bacterium]|nr:tagatose-6-phosphate kinase [Abditibacteriota bacterium]